MRNKLYQWLWYKIVRPLVKCDDSRTGFFRSAKRYKAAYRLSMLFGGFENNRTEDEWRQAFAIINDYIKELWHPFYIDMNRILKDQKTSDAYLWALRDAVHYSNYSVQIRQAILNYYI